MELTQLKETFTCPLPITQFDHVLMGHGSGGKMSGELLEQVFLPHFSNEILDRQEDQATLPIEDALGSRLAFTTDSFVVRPIFFPGGDIGKLAVHGTVNDLCVGGAKPMYLSAAFIIEEGLPLEDLKHITRSMREACDEAGVMLVTGDTKVVDRGKGDKVFIATSGVGLVPRGRHLSISNAKPGDCILVSGTLGDHGVAIMSVREGLEFDTLLKSDTAPLVSLTECLLKVCPHIRCMRDPTRGGLTSSLHELGRASRVGVRLREKSIPVTDEVKAACEMLGLDPLCVANEGKLIAVVPKESVEEVLKEMRNHPLGKNAACIGEVTKSHPGTVVMESAIGGERLVTLLAGEQLPRIC